MTVAGPPPIVGQVVQPIQPARMRSAVQLVPPAMMAPVALNRSASASSPLLSRIDSLLTDMERELAEDLRLAATSPLRRRLDDASRSQEGAGWLDDQISAIERRREACEARQSHLFELRRIVAEAHEPGKTMAALEKELDLLDASEVGAHEEVHVSESERLRTAMLEKEIVLLKAQIEDLEQDRSSIERERRGLTARKSELETQCQSQLSELEAMTHAVASEERRAQIAEESANQQIMQAAMQTQAIQEQLRDVEANAVKHRELSTQAEEAQVQAEEDLRNLEENSRAVLNDCRALQQRVRELENERAAFGEIQTGWEEERNELQLRIRQLEDERLKLEGSRRELADEQQRLRREHEGVLLKQEEEGLKEVSQARHREKLAREELLEVTTLIESAKIEKQQMEELNAKRSQADRSRIGDLELELQDMRKRDALSRSELQKIEILEQELADAKAAQARAAMERSTMLQLQTELDGARSALAAARANTGDKARIMDLEEQIKSLRAAEVENARKASADRARIAELEREVTNVTARMSSDQARLDEQRMRSEREVDELRVQLERETYAARQAQERVDQTRISLEEMEEKLTTITRSKESLMVEYRSLELKAQQQQQSSSESYQAQSARLQEQLRVAKMEEEEAEHKYHALLAEIEEREQHVQSLSSQDHELPTAYMEVLELVEKDGWDAVDWKGGFTILHWAAEHGRVELCTRLMTAKGSPYDRDTSGKTPIDLAREAGYSMVVTVLQQGAPPTTGAERKSVLGLNHQSAEALHSSLLASTRQSMAMNTQDVAALQSSLSGGLKARTGGSVSFTDRRTSNASNFSDVSSVSSTTRNLAIPEQYKRVIEQIDKFGWDKMKWTKGFTLLHWAAKNNRDSLCERFMYQRGDPNAMDDNGKTPITYARENNAVEALQKLQGPAPQEMPFLGLNYSSHSRKSTAVAGSLRKSVLQGYGAEEDED